VIGHIDNIMSVREKCGAIRSHGELKPEDIDYIRVETETLYRIQEESEYSGEFELLPEAELSEQRAQERIEILPKVAEATYCAMWKSNEIVPDETADLLIRVSQVRVSLESVMRQAKELLSDTPAASCLDELALVCELLKAYGLSHFEVVLGVARGLDFYTGTVFEIDSPLLGAQKQICGGGRYDKLVEEFGGSSIPATGFAFGFDRVVEVFQKSGLCATLSPVDVFVVTADASYRKLALEIAEGLRKSKLRVAVDLMNLDLREQLGYAANLGAEFAVIIGTKELSASDCNLRLLSTRSEKTVPLSSLANEIKREIGE
jgi:histidyl-tRNA synthetase